MIFLLIGLCLITFLSLPLEVEAQPGVPKEKEYFEFFHQMMKECPPEMLKMCEKMTECIKFFIPWIGIVVLLFLLINILLAVWVGQDARKIGEPIWIWVILTVLAGFVGFFIYLIVKLVKIYEKKKGGVKK
jgi:sterol desaturase/sphingolipid hydroxylase (fatty acid hydroxylase superfamily)